jgi:hypothetical protein
MAGAEQGYTAYGKTCGVGAIIQIAQTIQDMVGVELLFALNGMILQYLGIGQRLLVTMTH